jgi:hypothetical protein
MEQIASGDTQGRPFRFCINRFKTLISSNIFDSKSVLAIEVADAIIGELSNQPVSSDQFCKLLMDLELSDFQLKLIVNYVTDSKMAIYGWQNYHLFLLMAYKKYISTDLIDHCRKIISDDVYKPEVPACFIYLASIGHENEVENFISKFAEAWPYQHQRYFLISLQNTPPKKLKPLFGKVDYRLKGTVSRLKDNGKFKGETIYLKNFSSTLISEIYDEISPYE